MVVYSQLLASLYLGRESMGPASHLQDSPASDHVGENSLYSLCTAEGAQRPCLLENSLQLFWLEPGPGLELAAPCWVPYEGVLMLTRVTIAIHRSLLCHLPNVIQGNLLPCASVPLSEKCGLKYDASLRESGIK